MIQRWELGIASMMEKDESGDIVLYEDHLSEMDRLLLEKIPEVQLSELVYKDGAIDMITSHPSFFIMVEEATRMFDEAGSINFLSMKGSNKKGQIFNIIIELAGKKAVSDALAEKDAEIKRLREALVSVRLVESIEQANQIAKEALALEGK